MNENQMGNMTLGMGTAATNQFFNLFNTRKAFERQQQLAADQYGYNTNLQQNQFWHQIGLNQNQYEHQTKLNRQGADLMYEMWNKTNYPAQVKQMLAAGLNPALMYKSGGPGGVTGSQGGGSAQGGSAAGTSVGQGQAPHPFYINPLEAARNAAEIDLLKAQAESLRNQTPKGGAEVKLLNAETLFKESQTALNDLQLKRDTETYDIFVDTANQTYQKLYQDTQLTIANINKTITDTEKAKTETAVLYKQLDKLTEEISLLIVNKQLEGAKIKLTEEQTKAIPIALRQASQKIEIEAQGMKYKGEEILQNWYKLDQDQQNIYIKEFEAKLKGEYPGITNVIGSLTRDIVVGYINMTGRKDNLPKLDLKPTQYPIYTPQGDNTKR